MSLAKRIFGRMLLCGGAGVLACVVLAPGYAAAQVVGAYDTYDVGSNAGWNGDGQYTYNYYYGANGPASDTEFLGNPYNDPNPEYQYPIIDFQLPTLPAGQVVVSAQVSVGLAYSATPGDFNTDLTALGVGPYAPNNDYFQAAGTVTAADLIPAGGSDWTTFTTTSAEDTALANYINSQGYTPFDMLTMRLTPESDPTGTSYSVGSADYYGLNPVLTLTTAAVPEPATLSVLAVGTLALSSRRFRRRRAGEKCGE